jgi:tetratricopeptide (TPR) repeat protein
MRIFGLLGISVALAFQPFYAHAADEPAETATTPRPADDPDAIGSLHATEDVATATPTQPVVVADDRIGVAVHQLEMKEYADATALLTDIVAEQERRTSRYDPSLVVPLTLLGDALSGEAKYPEALRTYEQAQHIARVEGGLHTTEQVNIIYKQANTLASMGKIEKAQDKQEYAYETLARKYGPFSPELVPGLYHLAAWYERTSNIFAARGLYERITQIVERTGGETDPALLPALRGIALSYREERFPPYQVIDERQPTMAAAMDTAGMPHPGQQGMVVNRFGPGEQALVQIVKILSADPNVDPLHLAQAELDLADWYLLFDKQSRATPIYVHARQVLQERAGFTPEQITAYFDHPTVLYRPIPANPPTPPPALRTNPTEGYVEVSYTVTALGEVNDLKTIASEPEGMMDFKVRRGMRVARFRPRLDGDTPVASPNQVYRHTFTYYPSYPSAESAGTAAGKSGGSDKQNKADTSPPSNEAPAPENTPKTEEAPPPPA